MLDACAELVDEIGCDGLTTTLLAERARVAIGSVYQFFPDKQAVVRALTARNLEDYLDRLESRITEAAPETWLSTIDIAIDEYVVMHRTVPGFRTLGVGRAGEMSMSDDELDSGSMIAERLATVIADRFFPEHRDDHEHLRQLRFAIAVAVEAADALITMAFRRDRDGDHAVLAECGLLVRDYLDRKLA